MKVLAIASVGGHWIQLLRLSKMLNQMNVVYVSTNPGLANTVPNSVFYAIPDCSRWEIPKVWKSFYLTYKIVKKEKPDFIISTGAAPGLLGIIAGKLLGSKTIWVDSIANVERLSLSGKFASKLVDRTYVQWPELAVEKVIYAGNILR